VRFLQALFVLVPMAAAGPPGAADDRPRPDLCDQRRLYGEDGRDVFRAQGSPRHLPARVGLLSGTWKRKR
jgi:hypothetical protein